MSDHQEGAPLSKQQCQLPQQTGQKEQKPKAAPEGGEADSDSEAEAEASKVQAEGKSSNAKGPVFQNREIEATATLCLPIDRRLVGFLIGHKGSTIKAIQKLTHTSMSIKAERNKRFVYISGNFEACQRGRDVVECVLNWFEPALRRDLI